MSGRPQHHRSHPKPENKNSSGANGSNHKRSFSGDKRERKQKFHSEAFGDEVLENGDGGTPKKKAKTQSSSDAFKDKSHTFVIDLTDEKDAPAAETRTKIPPKPAAPTRPLPESSSQILYDRPDFVLESLSGPVRPLGESAASSSESSDEASSDDQDSKAQKSPSGTENKPEGMFRPLKLTPVDRNAC
jgi:hypothetical protein